MIALAAGISEAGPKSPAKGLLSENPHPSLVIVCQRFVVWCQKAAKAQ
jgi:hypothetical protein